MLSRLLTGHKHTRVKHQAHPEARANPLSIFGHRSDLLGSHLAKASHLVHHWLGERSCANVGKPAVDCWRGQTPLQSTSRTSSCSDDKKKQLCKVGGAPRVPQLQKKDRLCSFSHELPTIPRASCNSQAPRSRSANLQTPDTTEPEVDTTCTTSAPRSDCRALTA